MRDPSHSGKLKLTSTLLVLGLLTGAIGGSLAVSIQGQAQSPPPLSAEQTTALAEAKRLNQQQQLYLQDKFNKAIPLAGSWVLAQTSLPVAKQPLKPLEQPATISLPTSTQLRLNVERVLNEKSRFRVNGQPAEAYTATGKPGEKLTIRLSSSEFDPYLLVMGTDQKNVLAQDNDSGGDTTAQVSITLPETGTHTIVVTSLQPKATGRYQLQVWDEAYQKATLKEAEQLDAQVRLFAQQRKFNEAIPLAEKALAIQKQIWGRSLNVSFSLNTLAVLYERQKRYGEAQALLKNAFAIDKALIGSQHTVFRNTLSNLAELYVEQGRYAEAEALYQESLAQLVTWNSSVQITMGSIKVPRGSFYFLSTNYEDWIIRLAALYKRQKRYGEAEALLKEALAKRRAIRFVGK